MSRSRLFQQEAAHVRKDDVKLDKGVDDPALCVHGWTASCAFTLQ